jgi:hypothetical protein
MRSAYQAVDRPAWPDLHPTFDSQINIPIDLDQLTPIHDFIPIDALVEPSSDSTLTSAREIATDIVK